MNSLQILHLSDLHFGQNSRFADLDSADVAHRFALALLEEQAKHQLSSQVDLVVVTGDLTEASLPREYDQTRIFFEQLASELTIDRRRFVFAPGNHDVSWIESKRAALDAEEQGVVEDDLRRLIDGAKFKQYDRFLADFQNLSADESFALLHNRASVYTFPDLELTVAALNSCERESHRTEDHIGQLGEKQIQAVMDYWAQPTYSTMIKIIAVHHNPTETIPEAVRDWLGYLKKCQRDGTISEPVLERFAADVVGFEGREYLESLAEDRKVQVILHGHHHVATHRPIPWRHGQKGATHVLSAGSWGLAPDKLPSDQPNAAQLLSLDIEHKELRSWSLVYEPRARTKGIVSYGRFVSDQVEPQGFWQDLSLPASPTSTEQNSIVSTQEHIIDTSQTVVDNRFVPTRRRLPDERQSITHKFTIAGHEGYITVGMYEDGRPGEVFITMSKQGSTISGLADSFAAAVTIAFQYGVPLKELVDKFSHVRFEPSGFTSNDDIPIARSIVDYIFRWLALKFIRDNE